jgi:hypothetical protein
VPAKRKTLEGKKKHLEPLLVSGASKEENIGEKLNEDSCSQEIIGELPWA